MAWPKKADDLVGLPTELLISYAAQAFAERNKCMRELLNAEAACDKWRAAADDALLSIALLSDALRESLGENGPA